MTREPLCPTRSPSAGPHIFKVTTTERGEIIRQCIYCGHVELTPRTLEA